MYVEIYSYHVLVSGGAVINNAVIEGHGGNNSMYVSEGGMAGNTTINGGGYVHVFSGAAVYNTTVNSKGCLRVEHGGTASNTNVHSKGVLGVGGGTVHDTILDGGRLAIDIEGGYAIGTTIKYDGSLSIFSNGVAFSTTVSYGGYIDLDGGIASNTVLSGGSMYFGDSRNGGEARFTTLENGGVMMLKGAGKAYNTAVNSNGWMYVFDGGFASDTSVNSGGVMYVSSGCVAKGTIVNNSGQAYISSGGVASSTVVNRGGLIYISSGASAIDLTLSPGGMVAGFAFAETRSWSKLVDERVIVDDKVVIEGNSMYVSPGGVVSGVSANYINCGLRVSSGGTAIATAISQGGFFVESGGVVSSSIISGSFMYVSGGAVAYSTIVNNGGAIYLSSCGVASNTVVNSGGVLTISAGGICRGLQIASGAQVFSEYNSIIDFDLTGRKVEDASLINNLALIIGRPNYTITLPYSQAAGTYKLAQGADNFSGSFTIGDGMENYGTLTINTSPLEYGGRTYVISRTDGELMLTITGNPVRPDPVGKPIVINWDDISGTDFAFEFFDRSYKTSISFSVAGNVLDTYGMPIGTYYWRVREAVSGEWTDTTNIISKGAFSPTLWQSNADCHNDMFFARACGKWGKNYVAQHLGTIDGWTGTGERINLDGKDRIIDMFAGSSDANVLVMTDDANGDALFVDDIFSESPVAEQQARLSQIKEIRAGAGDDIVDLTSQRFAFAGGVTVYGGLGDDTIWANSGNNVLYGDAGNDRIVGGSGDDVIVGGIDNDSLHGGGGNDIFCFGGNWGCDTVEQLSTGTVTLWFENDSGTWDEAARTYTDGLNSVTVTGTASVTLRFGADASLPAGAFADAASEKIFEDKNKGLLA